MNPYNDAATFVDILRWRAEHQSARRAHLFLQDGHVTASFTYAELDRQARAIAVHLRTLDPGEGRALLLYPPGLDFIAGVWGCMYAGVTAVPLPPPRSNQSLQRFHAIAADAGATLALTTSGQIRNLEKQTPQAFGGNGVQWLATDSTPVDLADEWKHPPIDRHTLAILQYTSGSTGAPKGVMVSHANLIQNSEFLRHCFELSGDSCSVSWLPSFHDMALVDGILQPSFTGFLGAIMSPVSFLQAPIRWLEAITEYRATHCGGPNFAYDLCARKIADEQRSHLDLSSWVTAYNGAEPVHRATIERFSEWFAPCGFKPRYFYPCYGMAESTLIITGGHVADDPSYFVADADALERHRAIPADPRTARVRHLVGCGHPWLDTEIAIVDPVSKTRCAADCVGEIWVSGGSVAGGYWNREDASAEAFGAHLADTGQGPYLRTGDLGFVSKGALFVTGRLKDMIIIRGQNYYPQDIERTVQDSYPGLRPGCGASFSVEQNDEEALIVVQEVERTHLRHLDRTAAVKAIREAVANEYGIRVASVAFIKPASIPKTSSGKIQRQACRRQFLESTLEYAWSNENAAAAAVSSSGSAGAGTDS